MTEAKTSRPGRLAGKVALVTGAGPGLGGVIAQAMADAGAYLVLCDNRHFQYMTSPMPRQSLGIVSSQHHLVGQVISANGGFVI